MRQQIAMDEIPFSPNADIDNPFRNPAPYSEYKTAQLCDTVPPVEPPKPALPVKRPVSCRLIGWRHDGPLSDTTYETIEAAQSAALALHWAVYWKYAIQCGRDMVERRTIEAPAG